MKILVLTVGGSTQPLITSVRTFDCDKIVCICSDDIGQAPGSYTVVPEVLRKAGKSSVPAEIVKTKNLDDFNECYALTFDTLKRLQTEFSSAMIVADYTGGTKSMSAALVAASLDRGNISLGVVKGDRADLVKVTDGTQALRQVTLSRPLAERYREIVQSHFQRYDYAAATVLLEKALQLSMLAQVDENRFQFWLTLARALDLWDRFDHLGAWKAVAPKKKELLGLVTFLQACLYARRRLEPSLKDKLDNQIGPSDKGHGYELVEDLFLNAERRACQGRFDDAVARLYRALELLAQVRLKIGHAIDTSDLRLEQLPVPLQNSYRPMARNGKLQLPLGKSFELLACLKDPLGDFYRSRKIARATS